MHRCAASVLFARYSTSVTLSETNHLKESMEVNKTAVVYSNGRNE